MPIQQQKIRHRERRKILLNILYIAVTIGVILAYGLLNPEIRGVYDVVRNMAPLWLLWALVSILVYWGMDVLILHRFIRGVDEKISLKRATKISMIGSYYSALTPFATGGQPVQVMYLRQDKIPAGKASSVFSMKFIALQAALCTFFVVGMALKGAYYYENYPEIFFLTLIGIVVNAVLMGLVLFVNISKVKTVVASTWLINFLAHIKIIKRPERALMVMTGFLDDFHSGSSYIRKNKPMMFYGYFLALIEMAAYFFVTYCIYRALGLRGARVIDVIILQSFLYLTVSFVPLPGAALASEGAFFVFFGMFFPGARLIYVATVTWRLFTYYSNILVGAVIVVVDSVSAMLKRKKLEGA